MEDNSINKKKELTDYDRYKISVIKRLNARLIMDLNQKRNYYKVKSMSHDDIERIACEYHEAGDGRKSEIEEIVMAYNLPLVIAIIYKWFDVLSNEASVQDIMSHLYSCFVPILKRYRCDSNNKFSTYLTASLNGEALKYLDQDKVISYNYYYIVKKKGLDPLDIRNESDIALMLDENENSVETYVRYYSNTSNPNEENDIIEQDYKRNKINYIIDYLYQFIDNEISDMLEQQIIKKYIDIYFTSADKKTIKDIAEELSVEVNLVYKSIRKTLKMFRDHCKKNRPIILEYYEEIFKDE